MSDHIARQVIEVRRWSDLSLRDRSGLELFRASAASILPDPGHVGWAGTGGPLYNQDVTRTADAGW